MLALGVCAIAGLVGWAVWDDHRVDNWAGEMTFHVVAGHDSGPHTDALLPVKPLPAATPQFVKDAAAEVIMDLVRPGTVPDGTRVVCHVDVWWRHSEMGTRFWIESCTPNIDRYQ
ncbi:hypothetical protein [Nocardia sp. NPDC006630]|uniref:hypothetical protein n=1 Tax=Nocardia sp. NPDC006630 TaxID=3157181 RepID=UPI0033A196B3